MRLHPQTPARLSLNECIKPEKQPIGKPKTTWLHNIKEDLKELINFSNIEEAFQEISNLCQNRDDWREEVERLVMQSAS